MAPPIVGFVSLFVLCIITVVQAEDGSVAKLMRVSETCRQQHNIQLSYLEAAIDNKTLFQDNAGKAYVRCIVMGVGIAELKKILRNRNGANLNGTGLNSPRLREILALSKVV
ncbi:Hypothetical protein NTJ_13645 [Nesidiocoris tenuis]|uniref:Uncharacterized protein n=1 Tax=Nesidiocoris tenuis TaxID=355587 RepID=A0ABN7B8X5_9HEMI|nr:Hypothetical protein NTJ_13645 [Nesidiocoris tenuis]